MNPEELQTLSQRLNLDVAFLKAIFERFKPKNETEFIKTVNEINALKNELNTDNVDDLIEFYQFQQDEANKPKEQEQKPVLPPSEGQESPQATSSGEVALTPPNLPGQASQQAQEAVAQAPGQQQVPGENSVSKPPVQPSQAPSTPPGQFKKNFGDVNNPKIVGVEAGGRVSVVDAMLGKESPITQTYANLNPGLEPTAGGRNWGTDFRGGVGDKLTNVFKADLEVIKAVDGFGDGQLGNRDNQGFGNQLVVRRTDTGEVLDMAHLNKGSLRGLKPGDRIKPGEQIAEVGKSGNVTGPHVSIETFDKDGNVKDISDLDGIDENTPNVSYQPGSNEPFYQKQSTIKPGELAAQEQTKLPGEPQMSVAPQMSLDPNASQTPQASIAPPQEIKPVEAVKQVEQPPQVNQQQLDQILSKLPENQREAAKNVIPYIAQALDKEGILTPDVLAYAITTAGHESGFVPKEEIMAKRGINPRNDYVASLQENYEGGTDFRGRGLIQLTHKGNYEKYGNLIGEDLVNNPDKLLDPEISAKVMASYLKNSGAADAVAKGDLISARKLIQGSGAVNPTFMPTTEKLAADSRNLQSVIKDTKALLPQEVLKPDTTLEQVQDNADLLQGKPQEQDGNLFSVFSQGGQEGANKGLLNSFVSNLTDPDKLQEQSATNVIQRAADQAQDTVSNIGKDVVTGVQNLASKAINTVVPKAQASQPKPGSPGQPGRPGSPAPASRPSSPSRPSQPASRPASRPAVSRPAPKPAQSRAPVRQSVAPKPTPRYTPPKPSYTPARNYTPAPRPAPKPASKPSIVSRAVNTVKRWFGRGGGGSYPVKPKYK